MQILTKDFLYLQNLSEEYLDRFSELKDIYSPINGYKLYRSLPITPACIPALAVYLRDLTLGLDGNPIYANEMKTAINFERMKMISERVLELHHIDTSLYTRTIDDNLLLKKYLTEIDPPNSDDLYELSLKLEPPKSAKNTLEDQVVKLRLEHAQLTQTLAAIKSEERNRLIAQQQVLERIQNSDSKAAITMRALLESTTEGNTTSNEQIILLKLQLQAALDLCIAVDSQSTPPGNKK